MPLGPLRHGHTVKLVVRGERMSQLSRRTARFRLRPFRTWAVVLVKQPPSRSLPSTFLPLCSQEPCMRPMMRAFMTSFDRKPTRVEVTPRQAHLCDTRNRLFQWSLRTLRATSESPLSENPRPRPDNWPVNPVPGLPLCRGLRSVPPSEAPCHRCSRDTAEIPDPVRAGNGWLRSNLSSAARPDAPARGPRHVSRRRARVQRGSSIT